MEPISNKLSAAKDHYDVIVIGSGYGGGVSASRLARAGQSVCVLERGNEILPGDYPNDLATGVAEAQVNSLAGHFGKETGLYEVHLNKQVNALVACGLGGTSLINANVALEATPAVFEKENWPLSHEDLKGYYQTAREMLGSNPYPDDKPTLNKVSALEESATKAFDKKYFYKPDINVTFEAGLNKAGVHQNACVNCGDCCSGCNYSAKNTILMNYLPDAKSFGAEIFTEASVVTVFKLDGKWIVEVEDLSLTKESKREISADICIVAAGTLGSPAILMRSQKSRGLELTGNIGKGFSGNGDVIAFGYNSYWKNENGKQLEVYGVGQGTNDLSKEQMPGPCIAGIIDMRDQENLEDTLVIEEGVIPGFLSSVLAPAFFFGDAQNGHFLQYGQAQAKSRLTEAKDLGLAIQNDPGSMSAQCYTGPVGRTQTYLVMSHDNAEGTLHLDENERIRISWPGVGTSETMKRDNKIIASCNEAIQGQYISNPTSAAAFGNQIVTVHPIGGCRMGHSAKDGVVNRDCQVFSGKGEELHEGLYVCDGSVLKGSLSVNPLLTISAVTERACDEMAISNNWTIDRNADAPVQAEPIRNTAQPNEDRNFLSSIAAWLWSLVKLIVAWMFKIVSMIGAWLWKLIEPIVVWLFNWMINTWPAYFSPYLQFSETMQGFATNKIAPNQTPPNERISNDYELAFAIGEIDCNPMEYDLTIYTDNLYSFYSNPKQKAYVKGTVCCELLSKSPMHVINGRFNLFPPQANAVEVWTMNYDLLLARDDDSNVFFTGTKYLHQKPGSSWWTDTTTLFVDVIDSVSGDHLVKGKLTLDLSEVLKMVKGAETRPPSGSFIRWLMRLIPILESKLKSAYLIKFAGFFGMKLFQAYGNLLSDMKNFPFAANKTRNKRPLNAPAPTSHVLKVSATGQIKLFRYNGGDMGPVVLVPGYSATASSFATDTVRENLVERLTREGYDVWLFAYRASPDSENRQTDYTIDDIAMEDWPTAVGFIKETTGKDMQIIAHCVGSMTLLMALLKAEGMDAVRTVVSSQTTLHPVTNWLNYLKSDINIVPLIEEKVGSKVVMAVEEPNETDVICWSIPVPEGEECKNPVCHRVFSFFGPSYTHKQLNHATHDAIIEMFGTTASKPGEQLTKIIEKGYAVDKDGQNVYLPNVARLDMPITFIAGELNQIFYPETSMRTYQWLLAHNQKPDGFYDRKVIPNYAHMDLFIGKDTEDFFDELVGILQQQIQLK